MKNDYLNRMAETLSEGFKAFQDLIAQYQAEGKNSNAWKTPEEFEAPISSEDDEETTSNSYTGLKTDSEEVTEALCLDDETMEIQPIFDASQIDIDDPKYSYGFFMPLNKYQALNAPSSRGKVGQLLRIKNGLFTEGNED